MSNDNNVHIHPRLITVPNGLVPSEFYIKNFHRDDTLLLFKIHRSEPKLVDFSPKKGIVEPGHQLSISLKFIDPKITLARVLTKVVSIKRSHLGVDFNESWQLGQASMIKKVIEMRNAMYCLSSESKDIPSSGSSLVESFAPPSEAMSFDMRLSRNPLSMSDGKPPSYRMPERIPPAALSDIDSQSSDAHRLKASFSEDTVVPSIIESIMKTLNAHPTDEPINEGTKSLLMGIGLGLGNALGPHSKPVANILSNQKEVAEDDDDIKEKNLLSSLHDIDNHIAKSKEFQQPNYLDISDNPEIVSKELKSKDSFDIACCSKLSVISASEKIVSLLLNIYGRQVLNNLVTEVMKLRLVESIRSSQKITAIEISNCPRVDSLRDSVAAMFYVEDESDDGSHDQRNDNYQEAIEVLAMRAALVRDNLRHLSITSTTISEIDDSLNNFICLTHLDLSRNQINRISGPIKIPHITYLNLSHNKLTSLDYIQELTSLKSLIVSSNNLSSFKQSVNVLVPLASSLTVLDMSFNPVCNNLRYPEQVLSVLPHLKYFDAKDLDSLRLYHDPKSVSTQSKSQGSVNGKENLGKHLNTSTSRIIRPGKKGETFIPSRQPKQSMRGFGGTMKEDVEFMQRLKRVLKRKKSSPTRHSHDIPNLSFDASMHGPYSMESSLGGSYRPRYHGNQDLSRSYTDQKQKYTDMRDIPWDDIDLSSRAENIRHVSPSTSLLDLTDSLRLRRRYFGIPIQNDKKSNRTIDDSIMISPGRGSYSDKGYHSEGDPFTSLNSRGRRSRSNQFSASLNHISSEKLQQMQEEERYSLYNNSKPFKDRPTKASKAQVPLFEKVVTRMRDGFEKSPTRGTFPRASRGLVAEWYPMDVEEGNALRRRGYFDDTVGDVSRQSYRDRFAAFEKEYNQLSGNTNPTDKSSVLDQSYSKLNGDAMLAPNGSIILPPQREGRKPSRGQHMSRLYSSEESKSDDPRFSRPEDQYSDYRKWHPELYSKSNINDEYSSNSNNNNNNNLSDQVKGATSDRSVAMSQEDVIPEESSHVYDHQPDTNLLPDADIQMQEQDVHDKLNASYQDVTPTDTPKFSSPIKSWSDLKAHMANNPPEWIKWIPKENNGGISNDSRYKTATNNEEIHTPQSPDSLSRHSIESAPAMAALPQFPPSNSIASIVSAISKIPTRSPTSMRSVAQDDSKGNDPSSSPRHKKGSSVADDDIDASSLVQDNDLAAYLKWLEQQQGSPSSSSKKTESMAPSSPTQSGHNIPKTDPKLNANPNKGGKKTSPSGKSPIKRPTPPSHIATASRTTNPIEKTPPRNPSRDNSVTSASKSRARSPGLSSSAAISSALRNLTAEEIVVESKFTNHDLEYHPVHPRDAAMRGELRDIDQTFGDKNPLKRIMVNNAASGS